MRLNRRVALIGPIAPPYLGGPSVKNVVLARALEERGIAVVPVNTIAWQRNPLSLIPSVVRRSLATPHVFLSISTKGRFLLLPVLRLLQIFRAVQVVLLPTGGRFATEMGALPRLLRRLYLHCCQRCSLVLAETNLLAAELRRLGLTNVQVLPNFKPRPSAVHATEGTAPPRVRVLFLSRVHPEKGIELLFHALDLLQAKGLEFELHIHGNLQQEYSPEFMSHIAARPYAHYDGLLEDRQLPEVVSTYDIMVFPTVCEDEGFPAVLVDAAMAGLPVVASDWLANSEVIIDGYNGLLARPGDVDDLATKVARLIEDGELRRELGRNNRQVSERYTTDTVIGSLLELLDRTGWWQ